MEKLPAEMLWAIFANLSESDRLSASFTCCRWFNLLKSVLPDIDAVNINLEASPCSIRFLKALPSETVISICPCSKHAQQHADLLRILFWSAGKGLRSLAVEDNLIPKDDVETQIADTIFHSLLNSVPKCLQALHFEGVDLSKVRPWTMALLVNLKSLEELHILDTVLPVENESLFARMISASYDTLTNISVTNNKQITDKFVATLARRCPLLQTVKLDGCKNITSLSVLAFAEAAPHRTAQMTSLHVHATMFSCDVLQRYLMSPLLAGGNNWKLNTVNMEVIHHGAVCLRNNRFTNLLIVVYV